METAPDSIGKYQVTDLLGQGAMGVVYRALDPLLNRHVAVKVMSRGIATDPELRDRFLREARAAGSLQHPNIITIYDFGEVEGSLYIAMEYVEGSDLSEIIARQDLLPLATKLDIITDTLRGLEYAHSRGVVHRDVKPANIRVSTAGHAKLMDFGIARLEKSDLTKSGMVIGTPDYMAPEQVTGGAISPATDVFAVGVVLYEFLANRRTFDGDTLHAVLYKVVSEQPPPLAETAANLPGALQPILDRALAKDPARRYQSAGEMARDLTAVRTALSGAATVAVAARATPLRTARVDARVRPGRRRSRLAWVAVAAGAVVVAGALLVASARSRTGAGPDADAAATPPGAAQAPAVRAVSEPAAATPAAAAVERRPPGGAPGTADARPAGEGGVGAAATRVMVPVTRDPGSPSVVRPGAEPAPSAGGAAPSATTAAGGRPGPGGAVGAAQPSVPATPGAAPAPGAPARTEAVPPAPSPSASVAPAAAAPPAGQPGTSPPVAPSPASDPAAAAAEAARPQLEALLHAYADAIEARDLGALLRCYPAMPRERQRAWQLLFSNVRDLTAEFYLSAAEVRGATAELVVAGSLTYRQNGQPKNDPAGFGATAARTSAGWIFSSMR